MLGGGPSTNFLDRHRYARIDNAKTDQVIAQEVCAAELCSKRETVRSYVDERSNQVEPSRIARAIMVAGFMDENSTSATTLGPIQEC